MKSIDLKTNLIILKRR